MGKDKKLKELQEELEFLKRIDTYGNGLDPKVIQGIEKDKKRVYLPDKIKKIKQRMSKNNKT